MSEQRRQALKERLAKTRLQLRTLLMRLNEEQWQTEVYHGQEPWSVIQLVRHVVDSERWLTNNVRQVCAGGEGVSPDFDLARWNRIRQKKLAGKGPKELLADMAQNRAALLELIDGLRDEDWEKEGRHASLEVMSVERLLNRIADHEARHTADIAKAVGLSVRQD